MAQDIDPRGLGVYILVITSLALIWLSASLRAFVKFAIIKKVMLDDWLMFSSVFVFTAHAGISLWGVIQASKEKKVDHAQAQSIALYSWFLCEVIYAPLSALIRTSIAVFLHQVAAARVHQLIIRANLTIIWILCIVYFFIFVFQCSPPSHFYKQISGQPGYCIAPETVPRATIAHSILSSMNDFTLALLPIAMLWNINLDKKTKVTISTLLGLGVFAGFALIVRIPYVRFVPIDDPRFLDQTSGAGFWSIMETSLGIIAGCVATLRPLIRVSHVRYPPSDDLSFADNHEPTPANWPQIHRLTELTERGFVPPNRPPAAPAVVSGALQGPSSDTARPHPTAFKSDYLARLSRTRAWIKNGSGSPKPTANLFHPSKRDSKVMVQTDIQVTTEVAPEAAPAAPFGFTGPFSPPVDGGRRLSIYGPCSPPRKSADEPKARPAMPGFPLNNSRGIW